MAKFPILPQPRIYEYATSSFLGVDEQTDPIDMDKNRSPNCLNIIRDYKGSVRKRYGYKTQFTYTDRINGTHFLVKDTTERIIHAGTKYYKGEDVLFESGDNFSVSQQVNSKLYIVDGMNYLSYDGETMKRPEGRIPVIIIDRSPTGGGTPLEQINLIQPKRIEKFKGNGSAKDFQLTATNLDAELVTVKRLENTGAFTDLTEGTHFTVNRTLGKVTFNTAPPVTPSAGEDNIFITYAKTVDGYADRINKCTMSAVYGMNGAFDRLILTGNQGFRNYDWFSKANDFTYFGDLDYNVVGQDNASIVNYAIDNGLLITLKDNADNKVNSIVRKFELIDNKVVLRAVGSLQAIGALSKYSFSYLEIEPMYISTDKKITAITVADNRTERFSQSRSYRIDKTLATMDLKESYAVNFEGFYIMTAPNGNLYLLDGLQPAFEKSAPYSHRQYECYIFSGINARTLWVEGSDLWFGTADGVIKKFVAGTYNDDGIPVVATWETPAIFTEHWHALKTFRHLYMLLKSEVRTGIKVEAMIEGAWEEVVPYDQFWHYMDMGNLDFSAFTFETDTSERTSGTKINIKKVQQIRLRLTNDRDEPLSISRIGLTYSLLGNVK